LKQSLQDTVLSVFFSREIANLCPFPKENPSSREKSQTLPVLTETGRNHEKNVDFNNWNADQAEQLFELVRDIETYQFSKQSRAVEEGLRKDLNELKKIA
jgi:hypothetical protein